MTSPDGELCGAIADDKLHLWDAYAPDLDPLVLDGHTSSLVDASVTAQRSVVSLVKTGEAIAWTVPSAKARSFQLEPGEQVHGWVSDSSVLTSIGEAARLRDVTSGEVRPLPQLSPDGEWSEVPTAIVEPISSGNNGHTIAAALSHGRMGVWTTGDDGRDSAVLEGKPGPDVSAVVVTRDGSLVIHGTRGGDLLWWSVGEQRFVRESTAFRGAVTAIVELPDGELLTASADRELRLWDKNGMVSVVGNTNTDIVGLFHDEQEQRLVATDLRAAYRIATRGGQQLRGYLIGPRTSTVVLGRATEPLASDRWVWAWGEVNRPRPPKSLDVTGVALFDPRSKLVAQSVGQRGTGVVVRDVSSGRVIAELANQTKLQRYLWSRDGRRLLLVDDLKYATVWRLPSSDEPEALLKKLHAATDICLPVEIRVEELGEDPVLARNQFARCREHLH